MTNLLLAIGLVFGIWLLALGTVVVLLGVVNRYLEANGEPAPSVTETILFSSGPKEY